MTYIVGEVVYVVLVSSGVTENHNIVRGTAAKLVSHDDFTLKV